MQLAYHKEKYLVLSAIRFFKALIATKDDFYFRSIIKLNLFNIIFEVFLKNGSKYNLINSAILELFEIIRKENIKSLINHIVENHEASFDGVTYVETFKMLKLRYEQNGEHTTRPEPRKAVVVPTLQSNFKEEEEEEEYFNRSDDEDDTTPSTPPMNHQAVSDDSENQRPESAAAQGSSERKQQDENSNGIRLVDYEETNEKTSEKTEIETETVTVTVTESKVEAEGSEVEGGIKSQTQPTEQTAHEGLEAASSVEGQQSNMDEGTVRAREKDTLLAAGPEPDSETPPSKRQKSES